MILSALVGLLAGVIGAVAILEARTADHAMPGNVRADRVAERGRTHGESVSASPTAHDAPSGAISKPRTAYHNLFAQQLSTLLADPLADRGELIEAIERSVWNDLDGEVYDALLRALDHADPTVIAAALFILLDEQDAIVPFSIAAEKLRFPDWRVRRLALVLAASIPAIRAMDTVLAAPRQAGDEGAYACALERLLDCQYLTGHQVEAIERELEDMRDVDADDWLDELYDQLFVNR